LSYSHHVVSFDANGPVTPYFEGKLTICYKLLHDSIVFTHVALPMRRYSKSQPTDDKLSL